MTEEKIEFNGNYVCIRVTIPEYVYSKFVNKVKFYDMNISDIFCELMELFSSDALNSHFDIPED